MPTETREMNREAADSCGHLGNINAPKYGTIIPNRIFVGGISTSTTESDLNQLFATYGHVINTKIIKDRAGVSKGYGFITFSNNEEAIRLQKDADNITLKERRLNIAPAIVKQPFRTWNDSQPVGQGAMAYQPLYRASLNYNAVYVQPTGHPQAMPQVENQVYQNAAYPGVPQSPGHQYQYAYPPQPVFYQPYPYQVLPYDNMGPNYQYGENLNGIVGGEAQMYAPQYYMQQHPQDMTYYTPQQPLQPLVIPPENYQQALFQGARSADNSSENSPEQKAIEYTTSTVNKSEEEKVKQEQQPDIEIPIVSLNNSLLRVERTANRPRGNFPRRNVPPRHLPPLTNNNNPEFTNRNFIRGKGRRPPFPPRAQFNQPQRPVNSTNNQVPSQYQCFVRPQYYHTNPSMYSQPNIQRRSFYNKGKYPQKIKKNWNNQDSDIQETGALTPPITPKSHQEHTDELAKNLKGIKIEE